MAEKYKLFEHLKLPEEYRQVLLRLENGGLISPVLFGGAIRDSLTGYKPVNDFDIRFAGAQDPSVHKVLKGLLEISVEQERTRIQPPQLIKEYFSKKFGIDIQECVLWPGKFNLKGVFSGASEDAPSIDLSFSRVSCERSREELLAETVSKAHGLSMCSVAAASDGRIMGHRMFEQDAIGKVFRPEASLRNNFGVRERSYYERLREKIPGLTFKENPATLTYHFLENNAPNVLNVIRFMFKGARSLKQSFSNMASPSPSPKPVLNQDLDLNRSIAERIKDLEAVSKYYQPL